MEFRLDRGRKNPRAAAEELIGSCFNEEVVPIHAAEKAAYWLFSVIQQEFGVDEARRIYLKYGTEPAARKLQKINNDGIRSQYKMMETPNIAELARQLFADQALPSGERSTVTLTSIEKRIKRAIAAPKKRGK